MTDWSNLILSSKERKNLETVLDASRTDYQQTMQGVSDYVDTLVGDLFDFDHPDKSLALTDPDAIIDAARNLVEVAQTAADNRYGVQRQAWQQAAGKEFPEYALPDREDWTRVMWDVQKGFSNTDYNGLTYRQVMAGKARSGVTIMDLLPKTAGMSIDDMQQAYADFFRSLATHAGQRRQMADIAGDPTRPRWARVPRGRVTCAFCTMLAGRGFVYTSEEAAGGGLGNRYHNHCDCEPIPTWGEVKLSGYNPDKLDAIYQQAKAQAPDGSGYRDILAKMRSLGKVSDKITGLSKTRGKTSMASNPEAAVYSVLSRQQYKTLSKIIDSADGPAKQLYLANEGTFKVQAVLHGDDVSFYSPMTDSVTINLDKVFDRGPDGLNPIGNTWFHEFGHNVDFRLAKSGVNYSWEYGKGVFPTTLVREANSHIEKTKAGYQEFARNAIKNNDSSKLDILYFGRLINDTDYQEINSGSISEERADQICNPSTSKARKLVEGELFKLSSGSNVAVSDIMNGATFGRVRDGWVHDAKGYWDLAGQHLAAEAFADLFAARISTHQAWSTALEWFPDSCTIFETMLKEAL